MWLDLDLICRVAVSKREEMLATRYYPWPVPRVWRPLEGNKICIWRGYSSTHKKEDSNLLRSGTIETPFIGWVYVGPLWVHVYRDGPTKGQGEAILPPPPTPPTHTKKKKPFLWKNLVYWKTHILEFIVGLPQIFGLVQIAQKKLIT